MSITSSDLEEGRRPKLNLLDLPRELRDRIYGFVVNDRYHISPYIGKGSPAFRADDFRHLKILQVSKCVNYEVMQVLKMASWFIYKVRSWDYHYSYSHEAPTQHMKNVELMVDGDSMSRYMDRAISKFAGTHISRRTCHIMMPDLDRTLVNEQGTSMLGGRRISKYEALLLFFQHIKLLTGFETVVVQVDLSLKNANREDGFEDDRAQMLRDMIEFSEPALGPAVPCDSVREPYDVNFRFFPRAFVAKKLASAELGVGNDEHERVQ